MAEMLLRAGADITLEDDTGRTALGWALQNNIGKSSPAIVDLLKQHGATLANSNIRRTSIHQAIAMGDLERVNTLLSNKPDLATEIESLFGETPLHIAASVGLTNICQLLLAKKADVNAKDSTGATPLHAAAKSGNLTVVAFLLANNADPLAVDSEDRTVLHMAAFAGNPNIIQALIDRKADLNAKDNKGSIALDYAEFFGHKSAAKLLKPKPAANN